jgi:hypothetical protein
MCPPDHSPYKKAGKRSMSSTSNGSPNYRSINRGKKSRSDWSRESSGRSFSFNRNFESDKMSGQRDSRNSNYTSHEKSPFSNIKSGSSKNIESDKLSGHKDSRNGNYTSQEKSPFSKNKSGSSRNIESDKYSGKRDSRNANYSLLEENPFSGKKSKSYNYNHLLGAKKIKNKSRSGHQEGLFAKNVTHYQDTKTYHVKRKKKIDKVGVKKLD